MQKTLHLVLLSLMLLISGCVYKLDIQQGNIVDQQDVDRLRLGMTKDQVTYVLGTPVVQNTFHDQRWYYVYTLKKGETGKVTRKELVLDFNEQGNLQRISGNYKPTGADVTEVPEDRETNPDVIPEVKDEPSPVDMEP